MITRQIEGVDRAIDKEVYLLYNLSLMIQYNIGVSLEKTYEIKKLDSDYFPED